MRAVVQRVSSASVEVGNEEVAGIGAGLVVLLGVAMGDEVEEAISLGGKVCRLRIFPDDSGKMNLSVTDTGGEVLVVSQFTLYGDASKGNRPSFVQAAPADEAEPLVDRFADAVASQGIPVSKGVFGAQMRVRLVNEGPVTIIL